MKKAMIVSIVSLLLLLGSLSISYAHPPKSVQLSWNAGKLDVNISHSVNDPNKHYVYRVVVYVNSKVSTQKEYKSQPSGGGLTDSFSLGQLKPGTNVKVEAFCVIMGSTTGSITVP